MNIAQDEYGTVLNREETYAAIATQLFTDSVVIAWTDEEGTQFDILFALKPTQFGPLQRGLRGATDLFVAIIGIGAHAFDATDRAIPLDAGYFGEKFKLGNNVTTEKLAELINGVIEKLMA